MDPKTPSTGETAKPDFDADEPLDPDDKTVADTFPASDPPAY